MSLAYREDGGTIGPWGCMVTDASGTLAGVLSFSTAVFDVSYGVEDLTFRCLSRPAQSLASPKTTLNRM